MDTRKLIYNKIVNDILTSFPSVYTAQVRELAPKQIPCVFIEQISKSRVRRYATLANTDEQARLGFYVEVYARSIREAYQIMETAEDSFKSIGMMETTCTPVDSGDPSIYRLVARFSGMQGKDIYTEPTPEPTPEPSEGLENESELGDTT